MTAPFYVWEPHNKITPNKNLNCSVQKNNVTQSLHLNIYTIHHTHTHKQWYKFTPLTLKKLHRIKMCIYIDERTVNNLISPWCHIVDCKSLPQYRCFSVMVTSYVQLWVTVITASLLSLSWLGTIKLKKTVKIISKNKKHGCDLYKVKVLGYTYWGS